MPQPWENDPVIATEQKPPWESDPVVEQPKPEQPSSHPILSGIAAGLWRAVPKSLGEVAGFIGAGGKSDIQQLLQTGRMIRDVATGSSMEEAVRKEAPEVAQQQDVLLGRYGTREQVAGITGLGVQGAMLALPFLKSVRAKIPSLKDTIFGKTEEPLAAETAATKEVIKNATQERQVQEGVQPERARDDARRASTEAGVSGGVRPTAEGAAPQAEQVSGVPQPEQPRIISTAVQTPEGIKTGTFNQPHEEIVKGAPEEQKGFMVRDADGTERFVGREEAAGVAKAAGQVKPENADTTQLHSQQLAAAVSGTEMPPAAVPQIPEGAKATVKLRTETGEMAEAIMDAKQAEGIFTKEKSSYQALLNCLGA